MPCTRPRSAPQVHLPFRSASIYVLLHLPSVLANIDVVAVSYNCPSGEGPFNALSHVWSSPTPQTTTYLAPTAQSAVLCFPINNIDMFRVLNDKRWIWSKVVVIPVIHLPFPIPQGTSPGFPESCGTRSPEKWEGPQRNNIGHNSLGLEQADCNRSVAFGSTNALRCV